MVSNSSSRMEPTFYGYIGSTKDALLIIQGVLNRQLLQVPRRPHDRERADLIRSGSVFVFIEEKSGIKRWTDGVAWSPSRILGRFLVYRELDRHALSSIKGDNIKAGTGIQSKSNDKKLIGKTRRSFESIPPTTANFTNDENYTNASNLNNTPYNDPNNPGSNRSLVGSLVTSYAFKEFGLIKKTLSLTIQMPNDPSSYLDQPSIETFHLISYYSADDVLNGKLIRPVDAPNLKDIQLSSEVCTAVKESSLGGKIPIEDESYYSIDESNPNAIALGFNPGMHYSQGYQQAQSSLIPQTSQVPIPAQQIQHQTIPTQLPPQQAQPQVQPTQNQPQNQPQAQPPVSTGFVYAHSYPQYSQHPSQPQLAHHISPHIQQQHQAQHQPNRMIGSISHQHSASYSLPFPISQNHNAAGAQSIEYYGDVNAQMPYHQHNQLPLPPQQAQQQQFRYSPTQGFIPNPGSYSFISQQPHQLPSGTHHQLPPASIHQGSIDSSSTASYGQPKVESPSSPSKQIKHEHSPLTNSVPHFGSNTQLNLSSITPRDNFQPGPTTMTYQQGLPMVNPSAMPGGINGPIINQGLVLQQNIGGNVQGASNPNNGRWYYDESSAPTTHMGPYSGGYQQYAPQNP